MIGSYRSSGAVFAAEVEEAAKRKRKNTCKHESQEEGKKPGEEECGEK